MKWSVSAAALAAAVVFVSAPAFAGDLYTPNGFVGADYGYDNVKIKDAGSVDINGYGVSGSTSVKLTSVLNLQVDGDYQHTEISHVPSIDSGGVEAHLFGRGEDGALGLVGGWSRENSINVGNFGLEGARFVGKFTVLGDVTTAWTDSQPEVKATNVDAEARYYISDNFRVSATAGYDSLGVFGKSIYGWDVGAGAEYQLAKTPVSLYAKVAYTNLSDSSLTDTSVRVGVRWNFGGSLLSRERTGATFASTSSNALKSVLGFLF